MLACDRARVKPGAEERLSWGLCTCCGMGMWPLLGLVGSVVAYAVCNPLSVASSPRIPHGTTGCTDWPSPSSPLLSSPSCPFFSKVTGLPASVPPFPRSCLCPLIPTFLPPSPIHHGGRGSDSCQRRRRWRRPSVFAEEKHETDPLALSLPLPRPEPSPGHRESVPVEFTLHLAIVSSVLGPVEVTTLEEEAAAAALASSPPVRCPRSRRGGAAATAAPPLPLPSGRAGSSCDALGLHLIAQRGPRPGIAQVPVLAR